MNNGVILIAEMIVQKLVRKLTDKNCFIKPEYFYFFDVTGTIFAKQ